MGCAARRRHHQHLRVGHLLGLLSGDTADGQRYPCRFRPHLLDSHRRRDRLGAGMAGELIRCLDCRERHRNACAHADGSHAQPFVQRAGQGGLRRQRPVAIHQHLV